LGCSRGARDLPPLTLAVEKIVVATELLVDIFSIFICAFFALFFIEPAFWGR